MKTIVKVRIGIIVFIVIYAIVYYLLVANNPACDLIIDFSDPGTCSGISAFLRDINWIIQGIIFIALLISFFYWEKIAKYFR